MLLTQNHGRRTVLLLVLLLSCSGCATTGKFWPSGEQWKRSATGAVKHPGTWVPLIGAATVAVGGWDREVSDWARREAPLFGSSPSAEDYSDGFRTAAHIGMIATALAVHDDGKDYWVPMMRRMAWEHLGVAVAAGAREPIRRLTDRQRPNGEPMSLPSGHSTTAFAHTGMTYRNIEALYFDPFWACGAHTVAASFGALTAWARVEAGKHYPTDVMAGAALGNFVALFVHDAFLGRDFGVDLQMNADGVVVLTLEGKF